MERQDTPISPAKADPGSAVDRRSYLKAVGGAAAFTALSAVDHSRAADTQSDLPSMPNDPESHLGSADTKQTLTFDEGWTDAFNGDVDADVFASAGSHTGRHALELSYSKGEAVDASVEHYLSSDAGLPEAIHARYYVYFPEDWTFSADSFGGPRLPGVKYVATDNDHDDTPDDSPDDDGDSPNDPNDNDDEDDNNNDNTDDGQDDNNNNGDDSPDDTPDTPDPNEFLLDMLGDFFKNLRNFLNTLFDEFANSESAGGATQSPAMSMGDPLFAFEDADVSASLLTGRPTRSEYTTRGQIALGGLINHAETGEDEAYENLLTGLDTGQWHQIDVFLGVGGDSAEQGSVMYWIDGESAMTEINPAFGMDAINAFVIDPEFYGTQSPVDQQLYVSDVSLYAWNESSSVEVDSGTKDPHQVTVIAETTDGQAIEGATVSISGVDSDYSADSTTNEDGVVEFVLVEGDYTVEIEYEDTTKSKTISHSDAPSSVIFELAVDPDNDGRNDDSGGTEPAINIDYNEYSSPGDIYNVNDIRGSHTPTFVSQSGDDVLDFTFTNDSKVANAEYRFPEHASEIDNAHLNSSGYADEIYVRFDIHPEGVRMDANDTCRIFWLPLTNGPGSSGGGDTDGTNGWSNAIGFANRNNSPAPDGYKFFSYSYHLDNTGSGDFEMTDVPVWMDEWNTIEGHIKVNSYSNGRANRDGEMRYWVNGELAYERTNFAFTTRSDNEIEGCGPLGYFIGNIGGTLYYKNHQIWLDPANFPMGSGGE